MSESKRIVRKQIIVHGFQDEAIKKAAVELGVPISEIVRACISDSLDGLVEEYKGKDNVEVKCGFSLMHLKARTNLRAKKMCK